MEWLCGDVEKVHSFQALGTATARPSSDGVLCGFPEPQEFALGWSRVSAGKNGRK